MALIVASVPELTSLDTSIDEIQESDQLCKLLVPFLVRRPRYVSPFSPRRLHGFYYATDRQCPRMQYGPQEHTCRNIRVCRIHIIDVGTARPAIHKDRRPVKPPDRRAPGLLTARPELHYFWMPQIIVLNSVYCIVLLISGHCCHSLPLLSLLVQPLCHFQRVIGDDDFSHAARLMPVMNLHHDPPASSIQPFAAAAFTIAYSPLTLYAASG